MYSMALKLGQSAVGTLMLWPLMDWAYGFMGRVALKVLLATLGG